MKVLIVGGGGREHALAWKLRRDDPNLELIAAPGNPGIASLARCVPIGVDKLADLAHLAEEEAGRPDDRRTGDSTGSWNRESLSHARPPDLWSHARGGAHRDVEAIRERADGSRRNPDGAGGAAQRRQGKRRRRSRISARRS